MLILFTCGLAMTRIRNDKLSRGVSPMALAVISIGKDAVRVGVQLRISACSSSATRLLKLTLVLATNGFSNRNSGRDARQRNQAHFSVGRSARRIGGIFPAVFQPIQRSSSPD